MTSEEYFEIGLPTQADFENWTRSFFARVEDVHKRVARRYPELYRLEPYTKDLPLWQ